MAGNRFEFDENGDTFLCFLTAFYTIILIPVTYFFWPSSDSRDSFEQGKRKCMCQPCQLKRHYLKASMKKFKKFLLKGAFAIAWIIFFLMIYKLTLIETTESGFDPFLQLEISRDASPSEIRKAYKRLSLKFHPDKGGDPKRFILISKAYAALTDELSRKNWEEYGNPDGPTAAHFGIALPKWMIQKENFYLVIGVYVLVFMLVLPIAVGTWWYNTMRFSNNNVLLDTIRHFCGAFMRSPYMALPRVIKVLSNACEFHPAFNKEIHCRPSDNTELPPLIMQIPMFTIFKKAIVGSPSSVKASALIYAHMERIELPPNTLYLDKQYIIKNSPRLIDEMINSLLYILAMARDEPNSRHKPPQQHLATIENCMRLVPMLVQALSDDAPPLLQLPHIGQTQLRHMAAKQRNIKSIRQLVRLPDDKRRALLRSLSDEQYRDLLNVCASMPMLSISYRCEVLDDDDPSIWPLSMVTATIVLRRTPLFEPSPACNFTGTSAPGAAGTSATSSTSYNPGVPNARSESSAYDHHHAPDSQLYPAAASPGLIGSSGLNSAEAGFDGAGPMAYGDLADDYPDVSEKPKKSVAPVWDKGKRKKPVRRKKQQQQQQQQQRKQDLAKQRSTTTVPPEKPDLGRSGLDEVDSDADDLEMDGSRTCIPDHVSSNHLVEDSAGADPMDNEDGDDDHLTPDGLYNDPSLTAANGPLSDEKLLLKQKADRSRASRSQSTRSKLESRPICTHVVHCPYFPVEKFEGWWVYLVDRRTRQLITKPVYVATLQTEEEIQLRFVAPSVPGSYLYTLCVRSDSYLDSNFSEIIRFTVNPLPERIVRYLKEQEEAHSDSSAASSDDDDAEEEEEDESGNEPIEESDVEDDEEKSNQPAVDQSKSVRAELVNGDTYNDSDDGEVNEDAQDDDDEDEGEEEDAERSVDDQRLSDYLAKV